MASLKSVRNLISSAGISRAVGLSAILTLTLFGQNTKWTEQGPGPIINGQDVGLTNPRNPVSGAITAVVPIDANTVFVATVNGGVWKTTNATAAAPTWTPLTDTQLPALSIRSLAVSPLDNTMLFAGTGSASSFSNFGSAGIGVAKSIDSGKAWNVYNSVTDTNGNKSQAFTGERITSIVPTTTKDVVLVSTNNQGSSSAPFGLFRSTDGGKNFTQLSGDGKSGLPSCGVTNIVADPTTAGRYYAGAPDGFCFSNQTAGVYRSDDSGATWKLVAGTSPNTISVANTSTILLSVSKADGAVYAMLINPRNGDTGGDLTAVFFSKDQGKNWTQMAAPAATIFPGHQGGDQGAIIAHPTLAGIVFIAGDFHQAFGDPNTNGCTDFAGNVLRGDTSQTGNPWTDVVCDGANGTGPHADSRAFAFTVDGSSNALLLHGSDGGLFRLTSPDTSARTWNSFNGNIRPTEIHSIAFDPLSHILISGNQDTGSAYQTAVGSQTWTDIAEGDGAVVGVDADQSQGAGHQGISYRYESFTQMQSFNRHSFDSSNNETAAVQAVGLNIIAGTGSGSTLGNADSTLQFYNPWVLNNINPALMLIGSSFIYESTDKGDSLTNLGVGNASTPIASLSYGSRDPNGSNDATRAFYVGAGKNIYHRPNATGSIVTLANYPGSNVVALVMDPQNYQNIYVVDDAAKVWGSSDEGATWEDFTGDLAKSVTQPQTIEIFSPPPAKNDKKDKDAELIVGGIGDVVQLHPRLHEKNWKSVASGLPHAFFFDLHYNYACDTLVAGALGRGAWTLTSPFNGGSSANCPAAPAGGARVNAGLGAPAVERSAVPARPLSARKTH